MSPRERELRAAALASVHGTAYRSKSDVEREGDPLRLALHTDHLEDWLIVARICAPVGAAKFDVPRTRDEVVNVAYMRSRLRRWAMKQAEDASAYVHPKTTTIRAALAAV